jgi:hypothetical protein
MNLRHIWTYCLTTTFISILVLAQEQFNTVESDISLRTIVEESEVPLNREVVYHVELRWHGDLSKYVLRDIVDPGVTNLSVRGKGSSNKVITDSIGQTISIKRISYYLKPLELGMSYIDGVTVKYEDTILDQEESLISGRIGVKIIEPIPEPIEFNIIQWIVYVIVLFVLIGLFVFMYLKYRKRKQEELAKLQAMPQETIEEKYLRLLKETIHFSTENIRESIGDLSHLITGYFSEKYNLPAGNIPKEDLLQLLKEKGLPETSLARLKEFYRQADLVKFAAEDITESDFHQNYDIVELILQHQKSVEAQEEDK